MPTSVKAPIPIGYAQQGDIELDLIIPGQFEVDQEGKSASQVTEVNAKNKYIAITWDDVTKRIVFCAVTSQHQLEEWEKQETGRKVYLIPFDDFDEVLNRNDSIKAIYQNELGDVRGSLNTAKSVGWGDSAWMVGCLIIYLMEENRGAEINPVASSLTAGTLGLVVPLIAVIAYFYSQNSLLEKQQGGPLSKVQRSRMWNDACWLGFKMFAAILGWSAGAVLAASTGGTSVFANAAIIGLFTGLALAGAAYYADQRQGINNPPSYYAWLFAKGAVNGFVWSVIYTLLPPVVLEAAAHLAQPALTAVTYLAVPLLTWAATFIAVTAIFMMDKILIGAYSLISSVFSKSAKPNAQSAATAGVEAGNNAPALTDGPESTLPGADAVDNADGVDNSTLPTESVVTNEVIGSEVGASKSGTFIVIRKATKSGEATVGTNETNETNETNGVKIATTQTLDLKQYAAAPPPATFTCAPTYAA